MRTRYGVGIVLARERHCARTCHYHYVNIITVYFVLYSCCLLFFEHKHIYNAIYKHTHTDTHAFTEQGFRKDKTKIAMQPIGRKVAR